MKIVLGIPVYNEEKLLPAFLKALSEELTQKISQVIFINDGSTDSTPILLENFIKRFNYKKFKIIHIYPNQGYGNSIIALLNYAKKNGYEELITMDCDLQHLFSELNLFLNESSEDIISGSRYKKNSKIIGVAPDDRVKINQKVTQKLNKIYNLNLTDAFCGFKKYKLKKIIPDFFREKGYGFPIEFWSYAYYFQLSIKEVAVSRIYVTNDRSFGEHLNHSLKRYRYYLQVLYRSQSYFENLLKPHLIQKI